MIKFLCSIFGHHYTVSKNVTSYIKEYTCANCHRQVTTDVVYRRLVLVEVLNESAKTALVFENILLVAALVQQVDSHPGIEKNQ